MKSCNLLFATLAALAFTACGSDDNGGGTASTLTTTAENITTLSRGSGATCPDISGTYSCTDVKEGNNTTTKVTTLDVYTNNQGQQILLQSGIDMILDGEIHQIPGTAGLAALTGSTPQYSANCSENTISIHMVFDDKTANKISFTKTAEGHISGTTHELLEGKFTTSTGACSPATQEEINTPPANTPDEESSFDFIGWIIGLFF